LGVEDVLSSFKNTVTCLTGCSLEAGLPNELSVPHMLMEAFKNVLYLGAGADLKFAELE